MPVPIKVNLVSSPLAYGPYPKKEISGEKGVAKPVPRRPEVEDLKTTPDIKPAEIIKPAAKIPYKKKPFKPAKVIKKTPKEKEKKIEDGRADSLSTAIEPGDRKPGQNQSDGKQSQGQASDGTKISGGGHPDGSQVYETGDIDHPLTVLTQVQPIYPMRARRMGIEGWVEVKLLVSEEGFVKNIEIIQAKPEGIFEKSIMQSLFSWKFSPGTIDGVAVKTYATTKIRFNLEND